MKGYASENIRNVVLLGHGGSGKTTIAEAALATTGVLSRMGKVEDGNTVSDYEKTEIDKGYSIQTSVIPVEYDKHKINLLDTPGFFDFVGEVASAVRAAEAAAILVDASAGVQVGTEKAWNTCKKISLPRFFVINKTDKDNVNIDQVIADLKAKFGTSVATLDDKETLMEAVAETDEELLDKFFEDGELSDADYAKGLAKGIASGDIAPIITASATKQEGIKEFLDTIIKYFPAPTGLDASAPASTFVFKTLIDKAAGKTSIMKVMSGKVAHGTELLNKSAEKPEKLGSMFFLRGKTQTEAPEVACGDIFGASKFQVTHTGDTLAEKSSSAKYDPIDFPQPSLFMAVEPKNKGDDEKVMTGIGKLHEEDPSFSMERNVDTGQTLLGGQGEIQIGIITAKLKDRYGVDVDLEEPKVAYRETIKGTSDVQGKHKKQSGGAGQYGDVWIKFAPSQEEFEFSEELFGGSVPKNYVPAVEKGLRECMVKGPLSGNRVTGIKAVLHDGSYHDVDSNEMAFKIAASLAFKKGIVEAKPILLEPVMHVEVLVPEEYMGDVMGDMNKRRGKIMGTEPQAGGELKVVAEAPQAEMFKYAIGLRSMTQARGSFTMQFERYEEVPAQLAQKVIADFKAAQEAE
jgi:elongation factor G